MKDFLRFLLVAGMLALTLSISALVSNPASALIIGNPAHGFKGGDFAIGAGLGDNRIELFGNIGLMEAGVIDIYYAQQDISILQDLTEFGGGYRHNVGEIFKLGDTPVPLGIVGQYRQGTIETTSLFGGATVESDITQLNLGAGVSYAICESLTTYAGAVYQRVEQDIVIVIPFIGTTTVTQTTTEIGGFVGIEFKLGESLLVGAEIRPTLADDDPIGYIVWKF